MWYPEGNERSLSRIFGYCTVEAPRMHWLKRVKWKTGIAIAGMLLLLVLMIWVPVSAAGAYEGASGLATQVTGTVQATPTEDATVTALNKEKLAQEVQQLKTQNAPDLFGWLRTNAAVLLSTLVVVIGGLIGLFRWLGDRQDEREKRDEEQKRWLEDRRAERERRDEEQQRWLKDQDAEREKRAEERFQRVVEGLGNDKEGAKLGAAIMLRTFLQPRYQQFYRQAFDLVVANLRLRPVDPNTSASLDPNEYVPVDSLSQALITAFKEAFPLARDELLKHSSAFYPQSLDASAVRLDRTYLVGADLEQVWMKNASLHGTRLRDSKLRKADFQWADLGNAYLARADLQGAKLIETKLGGAIFAEANLSGADLHWADLQGAILWKSDCSGAHFRQANLSGANLSEANLSGANLLGANLSKADLSGANLDGTKLLVADFDEDYLSKLRSWGQDPIDAKLEGTFMKDVHGLDSTRLAEYKRRGAIIGEPSTPPQDTVQGHEAPAPLLQAPKNEWKEAAGKNVPSADIQSS